MNTELIGFIIMIYLLGCVSGIYMFRLTYYLIDKNKKKK